MTSSNLFMESSVNKIELYRWLSAIFAKEINAKTIIKHINSKSLFNSLARIPVFQEAVKNILHSLKQEIDIDDLVISLASDYATLFLGAGGQQSAPPYESAYTNDSRLLFQDAAWQNRKILEKHGLGIRSDVQEPADHIAFQLELMAYLAEREELVSSDDLASREWRVEQKKYLETHLLNWIPKFSKDCTAYNPDGFYDAVAQLTVATLEMDCAQLKRS